MTFKDTRLYELLRFIGISAIGVLIFVTLVKLIEHVPVLERKIKALSSALLEGHPQGVYLYGLFWLLAIIGLVLLIISLLIPRPTSASVIAAIGYGFMLLNPIIYQLPTWVYGALAVSMLLIMLWHRYKGPITSAERTRQAYTFRVIGIYAIAVGMVLFCQAINNRFDVSVWFFISVVLVSVLIASLASAPLFVTCGCILGASLVLLYFVLPYLGVALTAGFAVLLFAAVAYRLYRLPRRGM